MAPMQSTGAVLLGVCAEEFGRVVSMAPALQAHWEQQLVGWEGQPAAGGCGSHDATVAAVAEEAVAEEVATEVAAVAVAADTAADTAAVAAAAEAAGTGVAPSKPNEQVAQAAGAQAASGSSSSGASSSSGGNSDGSSGLAPSLNWNQLRLELQALEAHCREAGSVDAALVCTALRMLNNKCTAPVACGQLFAPDWWHAGFSHLMVCVPLVALGACATREAAERGVSAEAVFGEYAAALPSPAAAALPGSGAAAQPSDEQLSLVDVILWAKHGCTAVYGSKPSELMGWFDILLQRIDRDHDRCDELCSCDPIKPEQPAPELSEAATDYLADRHSLCMKWLGHVAIPMLRSAMEHAAARWEMQQAVGAEGDGC